MTTRMMLLAGAAGMLLSACNQPYEAREVAGVPDKFCVPKHHVIGRIPWIPSSTPEGRGFAFRGCWGGSLKTESRCLLPKPVAGGVVDAVANFRSQRWQDFGDDSLIKRTIRGADASIEVADEGRTVIASNAKTYWGWFVWRKATPSDEARLEAMDELSATCRIKKIAVPVESAGRAAIMCDRYILGTSYSLNYSFESESRVAEGVEELDAQVFAGIDRWRCKK